MYIPVLLHTLFLRYILRQLNQPDNHARATFSPPTSTDVGSSDGGLGPPSVPTGTAPAAMVPVFRQPLRGLRLTEGTDAVLQCSLVGVPKPRVSAKFYIIPCYNIFLFYFLYYSFKILITIVFNFIYYVMPSGCRTLISLFKDRLVQGRKAVGHVRSNFAPLAVSLWRYDGPAEGFDGRSRRQWRLHVCR
jgi:hypothetical protein